MNRKEIFRTIVKLSAHYFMRDDTKNAAILDRLEDSYSMIMQFPVMDDGNFMVVRLSIAKLREDHDIKQTMDIHDFFMAWLSEYTHHKVVALYSDNLTECLFFFEHLSDATMFKLKWCG